MRSFNITVGADGAVSITSGKNFLGYGGEHNAAVLNVNVNVSAGSLFEDVSYYRIAFDDYISDAIYTDNGSFVFTVPQEAVNPPMVSCQIIAERSTDDEVELIAKSAVFSFEVKYSKKTAGKLNVKPDVLERTLSLCESAKQTAYTYSVIAERSSERAVAAMSSCSDSEWLCQSSAEEATAAAKEAADTVSGLSNIIVKESVANAVKGQAAGMRACRVEHVSPIEQNLKVKVGDILLAEGSGELSFEPTTRCHIVSSNIVSNNGVDPLVTILLSDGTEQKFIFGGVGSYALEIDVSAKEGNLWVGGKLFDTSILKYIDIGDIFYAQIAADAKISGIKCGSDVPLTIYGPPLGVTLSKYGANLIVNDKGKAFENKSVYCGVDDPNSSLSYPQGTYTFSICCADGGGADLYIVNAEDNSNIASAAGNISCTFSLPTNTNIKLKVYSDRFTGADDIDQFQLEWGYNSTSFVPYVAPVTYTPNDDGTVDNVTAIKPVTTIMADYDYADISVEYSEDLNYTLQSIKEAIYSLGGTL